jgi:hypothetical protein
MSFHLKHFFRNVGGRATLRGLFLVALFGAVVIEPSAAAARPVVGGNFDGIWNVTFATRAGNCGATYNAPFSVSGRRISSAGGGKVNGGIGRGGSVAVKISVGLSVATGNGRLAGSFGAGRWSGLISGDRCSGVWQAKRQ